MEGREPPHIHVAHAGRYAKFWLDPVAVADVRGFRANEMTDIRRIVIENGSCPKSVIEAEGAWMLQVGGGGRHETRKRLTF